ncbi:hypothetical protein [Caulobacter sp. SSI4214]|uniref:hypothetical protein n=1 Tax=Caulobacter sp. SSI4214 TaxID=2575739 RepID=UPI0014398C20|nr:hypothetical protein [Caulobacter sp. SSI4214]
MVGRRRPGKRERALAATSVPPAASTIDPRQVSAVKVYVRDFEILQLDGRPMHRLTAQDSLKAARAALAPTEVAILDLVARGRSIADIATAAGRTKASMEDLLLTASTKLADHYEARPGDT